MLLTNTALLHVCTKYIYSIHTECDDLRPSAVEDCHDRSSKSNAAGQSTTGACVTLEGAARPDLGCSCSCKRERGRRPLNPATCLHNLTILTILKENTHNTHMPNRLKADSHILLLLLFSPRACEFNLTPGEHGELRGPSELLFFLSLQLLPVSGIPQFTLFLGVVGRGSHFVYLGRSTAVEVGGWYLMGVIFLRRHTSPDRALT